MSVLMDAVRALRNLRAGMGVPPSRKAALIVVSSDAETRSVFEAGEGLLARLAAASSVEVRATSEGIPSTAVAAVFGGGEVFAPLADLVDLAKERERLAKERERLDGEIARVEAKLANAEFAAKAPAKVLDAERAKRATYLEMRTAVLARLAALGG